MIYEHTRLQIEKRIKEIYPESEPKYVDVTTHPDNFALMNYFLWMLKRINRFRNPLKIDKWIIWILDRMEVMGIINNTITRNWIRKDAKAANEYTKNYYQSLKNKR